MKRVTVKELIKVIDDLRQCENMTQVAFVFDHLPEHIARMMRPGERLGGTCDWCGDDPVVCSCAE